MALYKSYQLINPNLKTHELGNLEGGYADIANALPGLFHSIFNKASSDAWSSWNETNRDIYVTQMLKLSTAIVISGKAISVANVFRTYIAKVAVHEDWSVWKTHNPKYALMVNQASNEVNQFRTSGYDKYMQFIDLQMIEKAKGLKTNSLNMNYVLIGSGIIFLGIMFYKKRKQKMIAG